MGYGEFVGGGSVNWRIGHADKKEKHGEDAVPKKGGAGRFRILVDGKEIGSPPVDGTTIRVEWPDKDA